MLTNEDLTKVKQLVQQETEPLKKDNKVIKKTLNLIVKLFDKDYVNLRDRVDKIEDHIGISPNS